MPPRGGQRRLAFNPTTAQPVRYLLVLAQGNAGYFILDVKGVTQCV